MKMLQTAYEQLLQAIAAAAQNAPLSTQAPELIAVSKQQPSGRIEAVLALGHRQFGENRVQEAQEHWQGRKAAYPDLTLHLIGPLQSNKAEEAVKLFDVIHTIDREKIALHVANACHAQGKSLRCLIQVNTGAEPQKAGIAPHELPDFLHFCEAEAQLPICGLMAIPPAGLNPAPHFALLQKLAKRHHLPELSMGMSDDFETAIRFGATYIRVGTALFGERTD